MSALARLEPTINPACGDNPAVILGLFKYALQGTPFDVVMRPAADPPLRTAALEDSPKRLLAPMSAKDTLMASASPQRRTLSQLLFEYVVLAILRSREGVTTRKEDLVGALPQKLKFGSPNAITTRLNKMARSQETGYINWNKGKQKTPITATSEGNARLLRLEGTGNGSLPPEDKKFLKKHGGWFGPSLDKSDG